MNDDAQKMEPMPFEDMADFVIPEGTLKAWLELPPEAFIALNIRRIDLDRFFFMNLQLANAVHELQQAIIRLSNGETEQAQVAMNESQRLISVQTGNVRRFMASVMTGAKPYPGSSNE